MVSIAVAGLMLLTPGAPVPEKPPVPVQKADRGAAEQFAAVVYQTAQRVRVDYAKEVDPVDFMVAAARGLYEECGLTMPDRVEQLIRNAKNDAELVERLAEVRLLLADQPALRGPRALVAAVNGFKHATDPASQLMSARPNSFTSIEMDFGIGTELEGVSGKAWMLYQIEHRTALGQYAPIGWLEKPLKAGEVSTPAGLPWRVRRVIPDSPAQKAGLRPGDIITHYNGTEIKAGNVNGLFVEFAFPLQAYDPQTGQPIPTDRTLTFRRGTEKPFTVSIKNTPYTPMNAFGVMLTDENKWDCMLDRDYKIGYIRIHSVAPDLDAVVGEMLEDLDRHGCRALVLDLRWCPGGYITTGARVAGLFLPNDALILQTKYRNRNAGNSQELRNNFGVSKYTKYPIVVLVGQETMGSGELIGGALRDNGRCVVMGQRSAGRGLIQTTTDAGFGGLQFRVTIGESFRPNGKPRQRKPDSGPHDDWGLKPDEGLEVPVTLDKSKELRHWAELQAIRPAESNEALDFDDPDKDPYRATALDYLRKKLGKPK